MKGFALVVATTTVLAIFLNCGGCAMMSSGSGVAMPTAQQLNAVCAVEKAKNANAPDCVAAYALQQTCNVAALGQTLNPMVATVAPVQGSILTTAVSITTAICEAQGFYTKP